MSRNDKSKKNENTRKIDDKRSIQAVVDNPNKKHTPGIYQHTTEYKKKHNPKPTGGCTVS